MGRIERGMLVVAAATLTACAGENLFSLAGTASEPAPSVTITAPADGFTIALGDSVLITADVSASTGGAGVVYRGTYPDGTAAYAQETADMNGVQAATLTNRLRAADGQVAGSPYIVVEVTSLDGEVGKDSVQVTISN